MDAYRNVVELSELSSFGITGKQPVRITNGCGLTLRVETGSVWITQQDHPHDVHVRAGESYHIERDGLTLASKINGPFALVAIERAASAKPTRGERFWRIWARLYAPDSRPTTAAL
jgi:hypothetical protein